MLFSKEITHNPVFYQGKYKKHSFAKAFGILIERNDPSLISDAYIGACKLTKEELKGFDAIEINLGNNFYEIKDTIVLDRAPDSGKPIVFTAGDGCVISGGKSFKGGFEAFRDGIYFRRLSDDAAGFRQLYADGKACVRSCFPKRADDYRKEYIEGKWLDKERAIEIPAKLDVSCEEKDLEVIAIEKWTCSVAKIEKAAVYKDKSVLYLTDESAELFFDQQRSTKMPKPLCRAENGLSLLTRENEWYFDRKNKILYYKPQKGQDVNEIVFTVPVTEKLVEVRQDNVFFRNLSFGYSNWDYPSQYGFAEVQGTRYLSKTENGIKWDAPSAAVSVYSENVHFDSCKIFNTGAVGLAFYAGSGDVSVTNCTFTHLGAGGISVGSFEESVLSQNNITIYNNTVKDVGKSYLGGVAILAGYTRNLVIDHNTVENCGYTGISVGWGWGKENDMGGFTITNNRVSNIINNYLFDGAGLYLLGKQNNDGINLISGNYLEGGNGYAGLYFDEFANNYLACDNVIMSGRKDGWFLLMHDVDYGLHNITVEHNIIETEKKKINTYKYAPNNPRSVYKKSKPIKRNVFVRNNYTAKKCKNFDEIRDLILKNSGAK